MAPKLWYCNTEFNFTLAVSSNSKFVTFKIVFALKDWSPKTAADPNPIAESITNLVGSIPVVVKISKFLQKIEVGLWVDT